MQFEIDINDPSDLKKYITKLQKRRKELLNTLGYQQISFSGSKTSIHLVMPLFDSIIDSDISKLYSDSYDTNKTYYVYVHCDPTKPLNVKHDLKHLFLASKFGLTHTPIYVGKGEGNRYLQLNRNDSHRKIRSFLKKKEKDLIALKIQDDISEIDALALESKLIDILGLSSLSRYGMLVNLDEGLLYKERRMIYPKECLKILSKNGF